MLHLGSFADRRPAHSIADLRRIHVQFGEGPAECVSMHAQLIGCFALVTFVLREDFENVTPFKLAKRIRVGDACTVHLNN
jgi:hypothetical protein